MINTIWTLKAVYYWTTISMRSITNNYDFSTQILMRSDGKLLAKALKKRIKSNVLQHSDVSVSVTGQI